ncbi:MAG: multicopper oxidase domain-containing protein [Alphaproteobacteria bacterium]|jgi:hypothetical protein
MHLHGYHFRKVLAENRLGPLRDTLLVERDETVGIAFVAESPGESTFSLPDARALRRRDDDLGAGNVTGFAISRIFAQWLTQRLGGPA